MVDPPARKHARVDRWGPVDCGEREEAGDRLANYILAMYAKGSCSAKASCELSWHAMCAGAQGDLLHRVALRPNQSTDGNFKRHLDKVLSVQFPPLVDLQEIIVPCWRKGRRASQRMPVAAAYDCLEAELEHSPDARRILHETVWPASLEAHPHRHIAGDDRDCFPIALYADGVQCTKQKSAGKVDTMIGITCYNIATGQRHLLAVISKRMLCHCGCRGWCTLHEVMRYLEFSLAAAARGHRPAVNMNGCLWLPGTAEEKKARDRPELSARFVVTQVKADWSEMCGTFGFSSWNTCAHPCVFCNCNSENMYNFDGVFAGGHGWGAALDYDKMCSQSEVCVTLETEADRQEIRQAGFQFDMDSGLCLCSDVPRLGLRKKDKLMPSAHIPDVGDFEHYDLPLPCTFWRVNLDCKRRLADALKWRNPLFGAATGVDPQQHLMPDLLHVAYLGVYVRYVAHVLWRTLIDNVWKIRGNLKQQEEDGVAAAFQDLKSWYARRGVPSNLQLGQLTRSMIGSRDLQDLKTKAAETGIMVGWATDLCTRLKSHISHGEELEAAGLALLRHQVVLKENGRIMSWQARCELVDTCLRHLCLVKLAQMPLVPKHHMWVHLSLRAEVENPRYYSTFLDESLNSVLATAAQTAHRDNWERTIFGRIRLLPVVASSQFSRL